ncbi:MAG: PHP domain-containing protein [Planctomycetota bacterium]
MDRAGELSELMRPEPAGSMTAAREALGDDMQERLALIGQYLADLQQLEPIERRAEEGFAEVADLPVWKPTEYEEVFLPGLRLAGIPDKSRVSLQSTADLHMHTEWSDGEPLDDVLECAVEARLDVIAITDHDEIDGALEARRRVHERRLRIAVVPGIEVSSRDGHIGGLFVTRKIPAGLSAEETVQRIHAAGGIAVAHHPFAPRMIERLLRVKLGCADLITKLPFDAIECTNAVPGHGTKYNLEAIEFLKKNHVRVAVTGSSDAHRAAFVGKGRTYFAGNYGVSSLRSGMELGFTLGAEGYWSFREKIQYHVGLLRAIVRNLFGQRASIN